MKYLLVCTLLIVSFANTYAIDAKEALQKLREGNERFVAGQSIHPNISQDRMLKTAREGQTPFATVLACSDSRSPVELLFDVGVGDLFVVKIAGNVADTDQIATIEYGTEHLHTQLLVVLGHSHCGAVSAVVGGGELHGHLPKLVDNIQPAHEKAKKENPDKQGKELINPTIEANTFQSIADILSKSTIVANLVKSGKLQVVGAIHDLETGTIEWLGEHPNQKELVESAKDHHHTEQSDTSLFSLPNIIFMIIFITISSLIAAVLIFMMTRKKS